MSEKKSIRVSAGIYQILFTEDAIVVGRWEYIPDGLFDYVHVIESGRFYGNSIDDIRFVPELLDEPKEGG